MNFLQQYDFLMQFFTALGTDVQYINTFGLLAQVDLGLIAGLRLWRINGMAADVEYFDLSEFFSGVCIFNNEHTLRRVWIDIDISQCKLIDAVGK